MKVKNLVFFGVAAAILSTASARAELPVTHSNPDTVDKGKVTSKYYVDSLVNDVYGEIPTNVSELTNDANYITSASIPTNVSAFTNDANYITTASVPVKGVQKNGTDLSPDADGKVNVVVPTAVSALTNDANYITSASVPVKGVQKNGTDLSPDADGKVNVVVPTAVSQLTGYTVETSCSASNPCALVNDGENIVWRSMAE